MAVTTIAHRPDLTKDQTQEIFRRHFDGKYKVEEWKGPLTARRDFLVVRNAFIGVSVKLEQTPNATKFVYTGLAPKIWARLLTSGLVSILVSAVLWSHLVSEIRQFIENAPEFK